MEPFWNHLAQQSKAREVEIVLASAWFMERSRQSPVTVDDVCDVVESAGIRLNINRSRLRQRLRGASGVSIAKDDIVSIVRSKAQALSAEYGQLLGSSAVAVEDTILPTTSFQGQRPYVLALVRQINGCRQQDYFDACAVMMRRLTETLAIDAFDRHGKLQVVTDAKGDFKPLSGIVDTLKSGQPFKLGRGMDKVLTKMKEVGDRAAHNRRYVTTKLDIDGLAADFRCLVAELMAL